MADASPLRVAFPHIERRIWPGGYNYQSNLFVALNQYCAGAISPVLFIGAADISDDVAQLAAIPGVEVIRSRAFEPGRRAGLTSALTLGLDITAATAFYAADIDAVFENARFFGWRLPVPAIAWWPDLQHRGLPQLFSWRARWRRELGFRVQIAASRRVLLSSNTALRDFREFYPHSKAAISVLQFASEPASSLLTTDPSEVLAQYGVPPKFFYLPNHLWRHKNHQLVLDALELLRRRGLEIVVVASGGIEDPREPGYFQTIMGQVEARGLDANFRHVGMIPLGHVYALLRSAVALINPSNFEGWSTTVEEAKSFGVPMILSDIDVHLEQTNGQARYFGTDDPDTLAAHLANAWNGSAAISPRNLLPNVQERVASFAEGFVRLVRDVCEPGRK